jgi:hypothetical protein
MTIEKTGQLIDHVIAAVQQNGVTPHTDIFVRIGALGPTYKIDQMKGVADGRGMRIILQTEVFPVE